MKDDKRRRRDKKVEKRQAPWASGVRGGAGRSQSFGGGARTTNKRWGRRFKGES